MSKNVEAIARSNKRAINLCINGREYNGGRKMYLDVPAIKVENPPGMKFIVVCFKRNVRKTRDPINRCRYFATAHRRLFKPAFVS